VQALMALPENAPVVVICPAAVKNVWYRECRRWRPDLFPIVLKGRDSFRWPLPGQLLITNYDILPAAVLTATGEEPKPRTRVQRSDMQAKTAWVCKPGTIVVADEAHALKTKGTKRTQRFGVISDQARRNDGRCWLLTGTPMLNRPDELWQVFEAAGLAGEAFGTWRRFQHLFGWYGGNNARPTAELPGVLRRVMLHRRRTEVLPDLPTKTYQSIEVNGLSDEVKALCDLLVAKLAENGIDLSRADEVVDLVKLQEVAFELIAKVRAALATAKIPSLVELVEGYEEQEEPLVVFSAHRAPVDTLGKRPGWASITGDTSQDERARLVDRFQAGELKGLAITIKAGGVGLTLTHAHVALFCDLEWTPALNAQAEDRICRIGQDRGVIVQRLIATHVIDEKLTTILHRKQQLISQSVERAAVTDLADMPGDEPIVMPTFVSHDTAAYQRAPEAGKPHDPTTNPAPNVLPNRREPATAMERWAANGLVTVAACDPDHATTLNSIGFSKMDNDFGHSLAAQFERFGVLSEKQWAAAVKLATRYRRQIGTPPVDQDEPDTARD
jgi:SNF2 family DNA or RNA helicase